MGDDTISVTGYKHFTKSAKTPASLTLTWEELVLSLSNVREQPCTPPGSGATACVGEDCVYKKGAAWSPVRLKVGGGRLNVNVEAVTVAVFDLDDVTNAELIAVVGRLTALNLECVLHSTHRHLQAGPGHNFLRLVVRFSREAKSDEWPATWAGALLHLQLPFTPGTTTPEGVKIKARGADRQCKDPSRLLFFPSRPSGMEPLVQRGRGEPLDVDFVKGLAPPPPPYVPPARDMLAMLDDEADDEGEEVVEGEPEEVSELKRLRKALVERKRHLAGSTDPNDHEKYRIVCAVLDRTPLGFAHDAVSGRSASANRAASILAYAFPQGTPWEAAVEILRPSVAAMEMTGGHKDDLDHWLGVARASYERATGRADVHRQKREVERQNDEAVQASLLELLAEQSGGKLRAALAQQAPVAAAATALAVPTPGVGGTPDPFGDAFAGPVVEAGPPKPVFLTRADKKLKPVGHNVFVWLKHSPETRGTIRYNKLTNEIETSGGAFAGLDQEGLATAIVDYMQVKYDTGFAKGDVQDRILRVAYDNAYDPLQDYLNGLKWDGVPRLDDFFLGEEHVEMDNAGNEVTVPAYVTARRTNKAGEDLTAYLRLIAPKVFIGATARGLKPGPDCQVDTMLVLEGAKEGEGKTSLIRKLAGPWYIQTRLALDNKDSQMIPAGNFLVELGELSSVRKSEGDALKSFLSELIDKFRLPYGKVYKPFPRRCIFIGTTNDEEWLTYDKGERRWWPVYVLRIDLAAVERDRDQLWAEAVFRMRKGERWHLEGKEENDLARRQASHRIESTMLENLLNHWWHRMPSVDRGRLTFISKVDLFKEVLKLNEEALLRIPPGTETKVAKAMKRMGFDKGVAGLVEGWVPSASSGGQAVTSGAESEKKGAGAKVSYMALVSGGAVHDADKAGGKK